MRALNLALTLPLLALTAQASPALAASPSGTAIAVIQSTDILSAGAQRGLVPESPIYMGDRIITDVGGEAQIKFVDDTRLVVGPGSSLLIDKFVFKGQTASNVTINAVRGTFRFITGNSPKNAYLIRTPTATLGLRGTALDVSIGAKGETRVALYGEPNKIGIRICDRNRRNCVDMKDRCDLVVVKPGGSIVRPQSAERAKILNTNFPYLKSQQGLWSPFRVQPIGCGATAASFAVPSGGFGAAPPPPPPPPPVCGPGDGYGHGHGDGVGTFGKSGFFGGHFGDGHFGDGPSSKSGGDGKFSFGGPPGGGEGPSSGTFSLGALGTAGSDGPAGFGGADGPGGLGGNNSFNGQGGPGGNNGFNGQGGPGGNNGFNGQGGPGGNNGFNGQGGPGGNNGFNGQGGNGGVPNGGGPST